MQYNEIRSYPPPVFLYFFFKSTSTSLLRSDDSAKLAGQGAQESSCLFPWTWDYSRTVLFVELSSTVPGYIYTQCYS